jgi:hypothetical protein
VGRLTGPVRSRLRCELQRRAGATAGHRATGMVTPADQRQAARRLPDLRLDQRPDVGVRRHAAAANWRRPVDRSAHRLRLKRLWPGRPAHEWRRHLRQCTDAGLRARWAGVGPRARRLRAGGRLDENLARLARRDGYRQHSGRLLGDGTGTHRRGVLPLSPERASRAEPPTSSPCSARVSPLPARRYGASTSGRARASELQSNPLAFNTRTKMAS